MNARVSRRRFLWAVGGGAVLGASWGPPQRLQGQECRIRTGPPPVIHVTDLFRPHWDPDDHWDLACIFALAYSRQIDLKGVLIDFAPQRRENHNPDVMAVAQMNYITGLHVPVSIGSPDPMRSRNDSRPDVGVSDHGGIDMVLDILRSSDEPVIINIIGSCRDIAIAGKKAPDLFAKKCAGIYLNAGTGSPDEVKAARLEYNVSLAPLSYAAIFDLPCPVYWMPCFEEMESGRTVMEYGTHFRFRQGEILPHLSERAQKFFTSMLARRQDHEWLTSLTGHWDEKLMEGFGSQDRAMWCTAGFFHAAGKAITSDGNIVEHDRAGEAAVFSFDPIRVDCSDGGTTKWLHDAASTNRYIFHVRDLANYQEAMTGAMRSLLQKLP